MRAAFLRARKRFVEHLDSGQHMLELKSLRAKTSLKWLLPLQEAA
jgi:hypothetical protein